MRWRAAGCLKTTLLDVGLRYGALLEALSATGIHTWRALISTALFIGNPGSNIRTCADGRTCPLLPAASTPPVPFLPAVVADPCRPAEMKRVARPGGWLLALAEQDYGARVDEPAELKRWGELQTQALACRAPSHFGHAWWNCSSSCLTVAECGGFGTGYTDLH